MRNRAKQRPNGGWHPRRAAARTTRLIILVAALVACGAGYTRYLAHDPAQKPAGPGQVHIPAGPARYAAEAAVTVARLQRQAESSYLHTHLWQAASALVATIDYMRATGSRASSVT